MAYTNLSVPDNINYKQPVTYVAMIITFNLSFKPIDLYVNINKLRERKRERYIRIYRICLYL